MYILLSDISMSKLAVVCCFNGYLFLLRIELKYTKWLYLDFIENNEQTNLLNTTVEIYFIQFKHFVYNNFLLMLPKSFNVTFKRDSPFSLFAMYSSADNNRICLN